MTTPETLRTGSGVQQPEKQAGPVVLDVRNLRVHYATPRGDVIAVNGVSFDVRQGEILGLVGESGCGKSTVAMSILRLVQPPGRIVGGQVVLNGTDLLGLNERQLNRVRWRDVALIPQGAMNSLNPVMRVADQCRAVVPLMREMRPGQHVACHRCELWM